MNIPFENLCTLLIAPTGWGKTTLIFDIMKSSRKKIVFYSPLKALSEEFHLRCAQEGLRSWLPKSRQELEKDFDHFDFEILILTYEKITANILGKLIDSDYLHILDEIHLNEIWGQSFRPILKEFVEIYLHYKLNCLFLSATVSNEHISELKKINSDLLILKIDNYRLKKSPQRVYKVLKKYQAVCLIPKIHQKRTLIFCKYRHEVKSLGDYYRSLGYQVLTCISGEVEKFRRDLLEVDSDMIIATSCLSHGVNLPKLDNVFILYPVKNKEMWVQMIGRAGRRGEEFNVYQMDNFSYDNFTPIKGVVHWFLKKAYIDLWKWKEFSFRKQFTRKGTLLEHFF